MSQGRGEDEALQVELARCREEIATVDGAIVTLLSKRVALARQTGMLKQKLGLSILDPQREAARIRVAIANAREEGLDAESVREIFWHILGLSRKAQYSEKR